MAELQPPPPPPSTNPQYWCYQCDKRVLIETLPNLPDYIICFECKNGFVESIISPPQPPPPTTADEQQQQEDEEDEEDSPSTFGNEFLQVLRLIAQAARDDDDDEQPPPPPPPPSDGHRRTGDTDYLRIELDGWQNDNEIEIENGNVNLNEDEDEEDEFDEDPFQSDPGRNRNRFVIDDNDDDEEEEEEEEVEIRNRNLEVGEIEGENEGEIEGEEDFVRRDRRDVLRLRLRDFASRAASRRNRILDWAEILMGLEDQSIEFRLQLNGDDDNDGGNYVGNPGDYVDAAGYEALLQNLAENDGGGGRRGAPPAAKSAVEGLQTVNVKSTDVVIMEICAICKEMVFGNEDKNNDDDKVVKQLECGHMYHGDCIVPWLGSRNTCPVCRYELPTDDAEYEEDRKKKRLMVIMDGSGTGTGTDHGCSSSSGGGVGGGGD